MRTADPETAFSLRALVREVCAASVYADPSMLAKEVADRIDADSRDAALAQALPQFVYREVSLMRMRHQPVPDDGVPVRRPGTSAKVRAIRAVDWRSRLREHISVGHRPEDWKFLGDITAGDARHAASVREQLSARNAATAAWFRRVEAVLTKHGGTVAELPESVARPLLQQGSAG